MKLLLVASLILGLFGICGHCGQERWAVKTLSDPAAAHISYSPVVKTVHDLVSIPMPPQPKDNVTRLCPTECRLVKVTANIIGYKLEADQDFHIVISDPATNETMIVEIPDAIDCSGACKGDPNSFKEMAARDLMGKCFGQAQGSFERITPTLATITGIPFFDKLHGQTGVAPNGIEIHPVLRITLQGASCTS